MMQGWRFLIVKIEVAAVTTGWMLAAIAYNLTRIVRG